jgi:hypothetical protein
MRPLSAVRSPVADSLRHVSQQIYVIHLKRSYNRRWHSADLW